MLKRLHKIRFERVFQERRHCADCVQIACGHGLFVIRISNDDAGQSFLQIEYAVGEAENRHDLAGDGDIVPVLAGNSVDPAAETVYDEAKLTVVHVHAPAPDNPARVDIQRVALIDMVIQHCGQKVVGGSDGVKISCEVEVDILHRHNLRISAARRTTFNAEDGAE